MEACGMSPLTWGSRQVMSLPVAKTNVSESSVPALAAPPQPVRARTAAAASAAGVQVDLRSVMFECSFVRPVDQSVGGTQDRHYSPAGVQRDSSRLAAVQISAPAHLNRQASGHSGESAGAG